ncbi:MAG TPA: DUF6176 family protein [Solirubrobacteraceae bacterium]|jgi:hypothetical protein
MDHICLTIPVLPGKRQAARSFMTSLEGDRRDSYAESEQRIGIEKELWFISQVGEQELLVAYMESGDFASAFAQFVASHEPFDLWFKEQLADATGLDLNDPPELQLPELVSHYEAGARVAGSA